MIAISQLILAMFPILVTFELALAANLASPFWASRFPRLDPGKLCFGEGDL